MIDRFDGEYRWLSNFWEEPVTLKGRTFPTAEHAYQACKTTNPEIQAWIASSATPALAKARGGNRGGLQVDLRPGWEEMKVRVMTAVIQAKFAPTTRLSHLLMGTGDQQLIEGNTWGDTFWGCVLEPAGGPGTWVGRNELGRILMAHRTYLQHEIPYA